MPIDGNQMDAFNKVIAGLTPDQLGLLQLRLNSHSRKADQFGQRIPVQSRASNTFPLSFAQQRLWFLDQLTPRSTAYNIPMSVRLTGLLDQAALARSLQEIVRRHEILRTTFANVAGHPVLVIAPATQSALDIVDLSKLSREERDTEAIRLATEEIGRPFDLQCGPLMRVTLLRLGDAEHILLRTIHHIICDKLSEDIFVRELLALYVAFSRNQPSPLPELPIQYADYAHWQRQWIQDEVMQAQLDYWKEKLAGAPELNLPTDHRRPAVQTFRGAKQAFSLSKELSERLETLSRSERCTIFMTLLAAFKIMLHYYSRQREILVGTTTSGRTPPQTEKLIGFFANTLVLRTDLSGNPSFSELLGRVREVLLEAEAHQDVPFEKLVELLQVERDLNRQPLFQVLFNLHTDLDVSLTVPGIIFMLLESQQATAKFDLTIFWVKTSDHLYGSMVYNTDLFEAATAARMTEDYVALLEAVVAQPGAQVTELFEMIERQRLSKRNIVRTALKKSNLDRLKTVKRKSVDA
jgi:Condensation domain